MDSMIQSFISGKPGIKVYHCVLHTFIAHRASAISAYGMKRTVLIFLTTHHSCEIQSVLYFSMHDETFPVLKNHSLKKNNTI